MIRCPSCRARDFRQTVRGPLGDAGANTGARSLCECGHCGLLLDPEASAEAVDLFLRERLVAGRFAVQDGDPVWAESYALRPLALSRGLVAVPVGAVQRRALKEPYRPEPAVAELLPLGAVAPVAVSLVILCRPGHLERLAGRPDPAFGRFQETILVIDAAADAAIGTTCSALIVRRPLAGDFAGQRNAGQEAARCDWVLQLDSDETLGERVLDRIGRVAALARRAGALSVGLLRRNLVDGVLSDQFPDVQYRLNHRSVRFAGKVHERPELVRGWRDGFIAPNLVIEHHLTRAHVERRSKAYEALSPGKGRLFERDVLLTPFRP